LWQSPGYPHFALVACETAADRVRRDGFELAISEQPLSRTARRQTTDCPATPAQSDQTPANQIGELLFELLRHLTFTQPHTGAAVVFVDVFEASSVKRAKLES
jgi:hypothetical protein